MQTRRRSPRRSIACPLAVRAAKQHSPMRERQRIKGVEVRFGKRTATDMTLEFRHPAKLQYMARVDRARSRKRGRSIR